MVAAATASTTPYRARALDVVDAALGAASVRQLLTRADAVSILSRVRSSLAESDTQAATIVDEALSACEGDLLIDRERVVNALLDVRLTLGR